MSRPIKYHPEETVKKAMNLFLENGYEGTSLRDIVSATGMNTRSMYNHFGSKNGLFKEALKAYKKEFLAEALKQVTKGTGLDGVLNFFKFLKSASPMNGCLFVNSLSEKNTLEYDSEGFVTTYFRDLEELFLKRLMEAQAKGDLSGNPHLIASQLIILIQGISNYSKLGKNKEEMEKIMIASLKQLNLL